ncbi:MAG: T9SS type A sorting domain-containing protein [Ignavibacteria bacterium]|nr:T9SS type A sorting domain-containing protein [Ignavibacteria bacterium]
MSSRAEMTISPNPGNNAIELIYSVGADSKAELFVTDIHGQKVADLALENLGTYRQTIQTHDWTDGVYVIVLRTVHETVSQKVVIVR